MHHQSEGGATLWDAAVACQHLQIVARDAVVGKAGDQADLSAAPLYAECTLASGRQQMKGQATVLTRVTVLSLNAIHHRANLGGFGQQQGL